MDSGYTHAKRYLNLSVATYSETLEFRDKASVIIGGMLSLDCFSKKNITPLTP